MTESGGKVLVVLGAGPGLGMSMAHRFGREGFRVALVSRSDRRHEEYRAGLAAAGVVSRGYTADVHDPDRLRQVLGEITADHGAIDTLYFGPAAADGLAVVPLPEATPEQLRAPLDTLLTAPAQVVREVLPAMLARGDGALFFGGGLSGKHPMPALGTLAPASAAQRMYVLTLAEALRERGVYAAALTVGGLVERGDIHRQLLARPGGFGSLGTVDPDEIADTAWRMYVGRDRHEAEFLPAG